MVRRILKSKRFLIGGAALLFVVLLYTIQGLRFDFYYDYNDDLLIHDILSGRYSGTPDGHSIQLLYPLGWVLSLFYRAIPGVPWFGLFMCFCFGVSLFAIAARSLSICDGRVKKVILLAGEGILVLLLMGYELVFMQYTVVCGVLATAAGFLLYTTPGGLTAKEFLKRNVGTVLLALLAFFVRSEMFLLLSPFLAALGIFHWSREKQMWRKQVLLRYVGVLAAVALGMAGGMLGEKLAYRSEPWKDFIYLYNAGTQLYDYKGYPTYEEAEGYYSQIGVSQMQYQLIDNYNYSLDESIDGELLWDVARYNQEKEGILPSTWDVFRTVKNILYRLVRDVDAPHNYFVLAAYGLLIAVAIVTKDRSYLWKLPLFWLFRMIPWFYVVLADRVPKRISHPLYYMELVVLLALTAKQLGDCKELSKKVRKGFAVGAVLVFGVLSLGSWKTSYETVKYEALGREYNNVSWNALKEYAGENPENYYCLDVYSTVNFKDKVFGQKEPAQKNYDILGGWMAKSPLHREGLDQYTDWAGQPLAEALLTENFYYVTDVGRDITFLQEFYELQGKEIGLLEVARFGKDSPVLVVFKVSEQY